MIVVYATRTGNVQGFVRKLNIVSKDIKDFENEVPNDFFILITYTDGLGEIPQHVLRFLETNNKFMVAVCASGNRNFGANFAVSADKISQMYDVPVLLKFELRGVKRDVEMFNEGVLKLGKMD